MKTRTKDYLYAFALVILWSIVSILPYLKFFLPLCFSSIIFYTGCAMIVIFYGLTLRWLYKYVEHTDRDFHWIWLPLIIIVLSLCIVFACYMNAYKVKVSHAGVDAALDLSHYLYFSIITFTTVGYGDYSPADDTCRFLAAFVAIMGLVFAASFIAVIAQTTARKNTPSDTDNADS